MIIIIFALVGSIIGVSTHIDTLQFQEIDRLNEKIHDLDKQVAVSEERLDSLTSFVERNAKASDYPY